MKSLPKLRDIIKAGDTFQMILRKRGEPVAGVYKEDEREIRSPSLQDRGSDAQ